MSDEGLGAEIGLRLLRLAEGGVSRDKVADWAMGLMESDVPELRDERLWTVLDRLWAGGLRIVACRIRRVQGEVVIWRAVASLEQSLQLLTRSADQQLGYMRHLGVGADEMVLEFDDAFRVVSGMVSEGLMSPFISESSRPVDEILTAMTDSPGEEWTERAVLESVAWERLREASRTALRIVRSEFGALQIHSVEERDLRSATCIVRCVGGVVRPGQRFGVDGADPSDGGAQLLLEWIECYGHRMDAVDPPYSAKAHLAGEGVSCLEEWAVITTEWPGRGKP
jgi:hypothetical protein